VLFNFLSCDSSKTAFLTIGVHTTLDAQWRLVTHAPVDSSRWSTRCYLPLFQHISVLFEIAVARVILYWPRSVLLPRSSFILSIDYCNSLLPNFPACQTTVVFNLSSIVHAARRVIKTREFHHITQNFKYPHWLRINEKINPLKSFFSDLKHFIQGILLLRSRLSLTYISTLLFSYNFQSKLQNVLS